MSSNERTPRSIYDEQHSGSQEWQEKPYHVPESRHRFAAILLSPGHQRYLLMGFMVYWAYPFQDLFSREVETA